MTTSLTTSQSTLTAEEVQNMQKQASVFAKFFPIVNGQRTEASKAIYGKKFKKTKDDLSDVEDALF